MSVLKNLRSIFIVDDEQKDKSEPATTEETVQSGQITEQEAEIPAPAPSADSGKRDDTIIDTLFKAIEDSNLSGFDYIEFKRSVQGLEKMVADEATRFKSAFSTASTIGITLDKLLETADYYVKVLDREKNKFLEAARDQTSHMVVNRKKEIESVRKAMEEKKLKIEQLTKELASNEKLLQNLEEGIRSAEVKIEETKNNFDVSFNYLREQILKDMEKMRSYLK